MQVRACVEFGDRHGGQSQFCDHMMTGPDEVTVNSEPVLIITGVYFWIRLRLPQNPLLFVSQYSDDTSLHGCEAAVLRFRPKPRASEHKMKASGSLKERIRPAS